MALTRSMLEGTLAEFNVSAEAINAIIAGHTDSINGLKAERDQLKAERDQHKSDAEKADDYKKASESWENKYNTEHSSYEAYKSEQAQKEVLNTKKEAYTALLKECGVHEKTIESILKVTDMSEIEIADGKIKDADACKTSITEKWSDFITQEQGAGASTDNPEGSGGGSAKTIPVLF